MFPLVDHQPASPSIGPAVQSLQRGLSPNRLDSGGNGNIETEITRIIRHYNEQAYTDASQQTTDHRQLHQTDSSMRKLM